MGALPDIFDHTKPSQIQDGETTILIDCALPDEEVIANIEAWKKAQAEKQKPQG